MKKELKYRGNIRQQGTNVPIHSAVAPSPQEVASKLRLLWRKGMKKDKVFEKNHYVDEIEVLSIPTLL